MPAQVNLQTLQVISKQPEGYPSSFNGISNFRKASDSVKEGQGWFKCVFFNSEYDPDVQKRTGPVMIFDNDNKVVNCTYTIEDKTQEELDADLTYEKDLLIKRINAERFAILNQGFEYNGDVYDLGIESAINILTRGFEAMNSDDSFEKKFTLKDNTSKILPKNQSIELAMTMAEYGDSVHNKSRIMKDAIRAMTDINEIRSFQVDWS